MELTNPAGEPVRLATRKAALLLAALVLAGDKGIRREALCEAFWADRGEAQARGSLRQALAAIRRALPDAQGAAIQIEGDLDRVGLAAKPDAVDVRLFDRLTDTAEPAKLARAAALYQGDILAGIALPEPLDQWFAPHQRGYRLKALQLVERLSLSADEHLASVERACNDLAERLLAADRASEEAHRALIRLHQRRGRMTAAHRQLELCKEALQRELGVEPEAQTLALMVDNLAPRITTAAGLSPPRVKDATEDAPPRRSRDQPSVIVMPFDNLSGEADGYFVDGVVEEITAALSRVRDFFVIARQSAFTYKGRFVDVREVGRELDVSYVVEGTVRRGGDRLRISVQLVDAETRAQLWSDRYDGATTDIFEFQDRIAAQVAGAIHPALRNAEIETARRKPPGSLRAYDLVLQACPMIWSQSAEENARAIALLKHAIAADPRYGRAHALLAWCHSQNVVYLWTADPEGERQGARAAIDAAADLIGDDPTAMTAAGAALSQCLGDQDGAATYIESALTLDPNNAWAWQRFGWVAIYRDELERAIERFERSLALSPLDPLEFNLRIGIAAALGWKGEYAQSAKLLREVLSKHPRIAWAYRLLAFVEAMGGDLPAASESIAKLREVHPNASIALMKVCHPTRGNTQRFEMMLQAWRSAGLPER